MIKEIKKVAHLITKGDVVVYFGNSERVTGINIRDNANVTPKQKELLCTVTIKDYEEIWDKFNAKRYERIGRFENQRQTILRYQELETVLRREIRELEKLKTEIFSLKQQKQHIECLFASYKKNADKTVVDLNSENNKPKKYIEKIEKDISVYKQSATLKDYLRLQEENENNIRKISCLKTQIEDIKSENLNLKQENQSLKHPIKHIPLSSRGFREEMLDIEHRLSKIEVIVNTIQKSWLYRKFIK